MPFSKRDGLFKMAIHNTSYDAANTAVRAFLTKVGSTIGEKLLIRVPVLARQSGLR